MQRKVRCTDNPANELMDSILQKRKNEKNLKNSQVQNYLLRIFIYSETQKYLYIFLLVCCVCSRALHAPLTISKLTTNAQTNGNNAI